MRMTISVGSWITFSVWLGWRLGFMDELDVAGRSAEMPSRLLLMTLDWQRYHVDRGHDPGRGFSKTMDGFDILDGWS